MWGNIQISYLIFSEFKQINETFYSLRNVRRNRIWKIEFYSKQEDNPFQTKENINWCSTKKLSQTVPYVQGEHKQNKKRIRHQTE